ncbi:MAG TPA: methylmalonyl-CoA mutase family protein, partial [bacterium]
STLTAQQPENNIVRVALQALAAILGGTQSLHTNSMDEALALPSEKAARIALRTQQIIAHESGAADTIDPLAGSYYIEHLTDEIESEAQRLLDKIQSLGGAVSAIEKGFFQREIAAQAYKTQKAVEAQEKVIVGVNSLKLDEPSHLELLKVDQTVVIQQIARLRRFREQRDNNAVKRTLDQLIQAASGRDNLMPLILNAVESHATLGEISDALRSCWGEYRGEAA